jgi:hypothetical protein
MGRTTTPTYRIEITEANGRVGINAWRREYGKPTTAAIAAYVDAFAQSCLPGGINSHIAHLALPAITARIVRQATGEVVATWAALKNNRLR